MMNPLCEPRVARASDVLRSLVPGCLLFALAATPAVGQLAGPPETLTSDTGSRGDFFGITSSLWGDRIAIGAIRANDGRGTIHLYERSATEWISVAELEAGPGAHDLFGIHLQLAGTTLMASDAGPNFGTNHVYVFEREGAEWVRTQVLETSGGAGERVRVLALRSDVAVIGAPYADHPQAEDAGAIYLFEKVNGRWRESRRVYAEHPLEGGLFGGAAALSGGHMLVAEKTHVWKDNAVYFYARAGGEWVETARVRASGGMPRDLFGKTVDLDGRIAVIGAPERAETWHRQGAVYVFERANDETWVERTKLVEDFPNAGWFGNLYGTSIALAGDDLVVGAPRAAPAAGVGGQAFLYRRHAPSGRWNRILALDGALAAHLGMSVELSERWMIVSAPDLVSLAPVGPRAFAWRRDTPDAGSTYCLSNESTSGRLTLLRALGSEHVADNDLAFVVNDLPAQSFAVLLASRSIDHRPFGSGALCLGRPFVFASGVVGRSALDQTLSIPFDLADPPFGAPIEPRESWGFQLWFRDGAGANTSSAVTVSFL